MTALPWLQRLDAIVDTRALGRAVFAVVPLLLLAVLSGNADWLSVAIMPIAMLVAHDRSQLAPLGVVAHCLAISAAFVLLMASLADPLLFILATSLLGMVSVWVTAGGSALRSLGNFTFIPALYLACENAEGVTGHALMTKATGVVPLLIVAALPIVLAVSIEHLGSRSAALPSFAHFRKWTRLPRDIERSAYKERMVTVALAVACAAALVEWRHIDHGQWVIWSAASVVTGDVLTARKKFRARITGAIVGVSLGIVVGLLIPHVAPVRVVVTLGALLTLVCIRPYTLAFGTRCACVAMAFVVAGQPWLSGGERLLNVAAGSAVGLLWALAAAVVTPYFEPRSG